MSCEPKVSVVIPIYNVESYLNECLDSLINQKLRDIEIICVNDGSTDHSLDIINSYAKCDCRVVVIDKPNSGYGDSVNKGFVVAKGKYVGIVESDDYIDADMFWTLFNVAEEYDLDFVKSAYYLTYGSKKRTDVETQLLSGEKCNTVINAKKCPEIFRLKTTNWSGIYLNSFIRENGIEHNITPGASYQDTGFYFQVCTKAKRCMFLDRCFYHYRQDNPNSSVNNRGKVYVITEEYDFIKTRLIEGGLFDTYRFDFFYNKFDAYFNFNYNRISFKFKQEFLEYMSNELKKDIVEGLYNKIKFNEDEQRVIHDIISDPIQFYIDNLIWRHTNHKHLLKSTRTVKSSLLNRFYKKLRAII